MTPKGNAEAPQRSCLGCKASKDKNLLLRFIQTPDMEVLPDLENRPLHMWLDLEWRYTDPPAASGGGQLAGQARRIVRDVFETFESGSIQQVIYKMGTRMLSEMPALSEVHLEANNRTWDTIAEQEHAVGVYTEPRPPYGCLGLRLRR